MTDTYHHVDHPNAQRFDRVEARVVERWKESELSGDEWRFSFVVDLYSHGVLVESIGASSIQGALIQAAARFDHFGPGGNELVLRYSDDEVRGFCDRHRHRGDCGLDDADDNYTIIDLGETS